MAGLTREQRAEKMDRVSREQELREAEPIHDQYDSWDNDLLLSTEMIPARPGFVQRWVRTTVKGADDQSNVFKKFNKGWKPRLLDTVPKGQFVMNQDFQGQQVIGIHGMILMERPKHIHERQKEQVKEATSLQMKAVENDMYKVHDPSSGFGRPEFSNTSKVSRGRVAPIDD